ncbi:hypothetical protein BC832DRAFT_141707 [Gaertneriomyces semiglobifer]|nr:hypothetical protein BC832DRAFT_141707 [Gaertneriomyces semiglobifer]
MEHRVSGRAPESETRSIVVNMMVLVAVTSITFVWTCSAGHHIKQSLSRKGSSYLYCLTLSYMPNHVAAKIKAPVNAAESAGLRPENSGVRRSRTA